MSDDLGILDALGKVCMVCLICAAVVFGAINGWTRYVRWYQQHIGMEIEQQEQPHETQRFHTD